MRAAVLLLASLGMFVAGSNASAGWCHRWFGHRAYVGFRVGWCGPRYVSYRYCAPAYYRPIYYRRVYCAPTYYWAPPVYYYPSWSFSFGPFCSTTPAPSAESVYAARRSSPPAFAAVPKLKPLPATREPAPRPEPAAEPELARPRPSVDIRLTNLETRRRGEKFLEFGDALFREQRYHEALQRYKKAATTSPDLAEAWFRQAHALIATRRYDLAATAMKRALALRDDPDRGEFRLASLYDGGDIALLSHLDHLARAALEASDNGDLYFLIGVSLYYDGQKDRAVKFFRKAAELAGGEPPHVRPFLDDYRALRTAAVVKPGRDA